MVGESGPRVLLNRLLHPSLTSADTSTNPYVQHRAGGCQIAGWSRATYSIGQGAAP